MADASRSPAVPSSLDRSAVERILSRATELQGSGSNDPEGRLTETQLEALAKEVGLDAVNLRQAIAEERTRVALPTETGIVASLFGASVVSAQRTVQGTPAPILKALDEWMQRQEGLIPQRYFGDRVVWEAQSGFTGAMRRSLSGRGRSLSRARTVGATVVALDARNALVRLDADLAAHRSRMLNQTAGYTGAGVVASGVLAALSFATAAAIAPALLLAPIAYAGSRAAHRSALERAQLTLEQVLDRLERGDANRPPSLISMLAAAVGVKPI